MKTPSDKAPTPTTNKTSTHGYNLVRKDGVVKIALTFPVLSIVNACGFRKKRDLCFDKDYSCVCDAKMVNLESLKAHIRWANRSKNKCDYCDFECRGSTKLQDHIKMHLDGKKHVKLGSNHKKFAKRAAEIMSVVPRKLKKFSN
jgi:hypothetical protein